MAQYFTDWSNKSKDNFKSLNSQVVDDGIPTDRGNQLIDESAILNTQKNIGV